MWDDHSKLQRLCALQDELATLNDLDVLLERILSLARQFVTADAGSIYLRDQDTLKFSYTQNEALSRRLPPGRKLVYATFSIPIGDNSIAGHVAHTGEMLNIQDAYAIPPSFPYQFNDEFDRLSQYHTTSMLTVPMRTSQGVIVGVLQVINALDEMGRAVPFQRDDEAMIGMFANAAAVAVERAQMTRALILRMISMAELRDPKETASHVNRVGAYAIEIYENWALRHGVDRAEIERNRDVLRMAAMLHDVGKVAISDLILKKPDRLTDDEYTLMKQHTRLGACLFINPGSTFDAAAAEVALNHHENWDGTGYLGHVALATGAPLPGRTDEDGKPLGKRAEDIPLFGRIVAIADVFDALRSRRVYKPPLDEQTVFGIITQERGKKFDPEVVDAFFASTDLLRAIAARYVDPEEE